MLQRAWSALSSGCVWLGVWIKTGILRLLGEHKDSSSVSQPLPRNGDPSNEPVGGTATHKLIHMVNKLQDAFISSDMRGLRLPQIAVVGGQSVGKSSVLEGIVGRDFLPRGTGTVTRCPIVLQCKPSDRDFAEFLHDRGTTYDFKEVADEIIRKTNEMAGENKNIIKDPIRLTIHSPRVLDITLVDLPGITKNPIGDQPADIEQQTRDLAMSYVRDQHCIILAVSPANDDLQNSEAMKIAREVDPNGDRTIGVITKIDLMDAGTSAVRLLQNPLFPLKLGYIAVKNRSQADIVDEKDVQSALKEEERFIQRNSEYRELQGKFGAENLQKLLHKTLHNHIDRCLPQLRKDLVEKRSEADVELKDLYRNTKPDENLRKLLQKYGQKVKMDLAGSTHAVQLDQMAAGAEICDLFLETFPDKLSKDKISPIDEQMIRTTIRNIHGYKFPIYTPDQAFHAIAVHVIEHYKTQVTECVDSVKQCLETLTEEAGRLLENHPHLQCQVKILVDGFIVNTEQRAKKHLLTHIEIEKTFKNTEHPDFQEKMRKHKADNPNENGPIDTNAAHEKEIRQMLDWYMDVVAKTVLDIVPKCIVYMQLRSIEDYVTEELTSEIRENHDPKFLMRQDEEKERDIALHQKHYTTADKAISLIDEFYNNRTF